MRRAIGLALAIVLVDAAPVRTQTLATDDAVLRAIWREAMEASQLEPMAQALLDSIGPRLTGSPGLADAQSWARGLLEDWGVASQLEQYGTWEGWDRGVTHIDLVEPRTRSLEGRMLAWSPGTEGQGVEGGVTYLPEIDTAEDWDSFLRTVRGSWVMLSFPQPTCRPNEQWAEYQVNGSAQRMSEARRLASNRWNQSLTVARSRSGSLVAIHAALENAGAAGIITSEWTGAPGTNQVHNAYNRRTPTFELSCEDYGLVYRLAANVQNPAVRLTAEARSLGEVPVFNVIGEIRGAELPNEFVMLSAHLDSWDSSSGATDNGTGTVLMLEAMRVLRAAYPLPRRTILLGLWSGEEQGLNGSQAFSEDHPEVVAGLQALWNADSGTGRIANISALGLVNAGGSLARWLSRVPREVSQHVSLELPGTPGSGSDYASFLCYGAPSFNLGSLAESNWDYGDSTWHTNRDTFDKVVFDEVRNNVALTASLAYLASEDPEFTNRDRREVMTTNRGAPRPWPSCGAAARSSPNAPR